jgi:hypothetical protein
MPASCDLEQVCALLASGANIVTTRGEFHRPASLDPAVRDQVEAACARGGTSIHSTGSSPGFITEAVPLVLTSIQRRLDGLTIDGFADLSQRDSPRLLFDVMGFGRSLAAGTVAAQRMAVSGIRDGRPLLRFRATWYCTTDLDPAWDVRATGWHIAIEGDAPLDVDLRFPVPLDRMAAMTPGYTAHRAVNAVPYVGAAPPGIRTTADLPQIIPALHDQGLMARNMGLTGWSPQVIRAGKGELRHRPYHQQPGGLAENHPGAAAVIEQRAKGLRKISVHPGSSIQPPPLDPVHGVRARVIIRHPDQRCRRSVRPQSPRPSTARRLSRTRR